MASINVCEDMKVTRSGLYSLSLIGESYPTFTIVSNCINVHTLHSVYSSLWSSYILNIIKEGEFNEDKWFFQAEYRGGARGERGA